MCRWFAHENVWHLIRFILPFSDPHSLVDLISHILKSGSHWHKNDLKKVACGILDQNVKYNYFLYLLSERLKRIRY